MSVPTVGGAERRAGRQLVRRSVLPLARLLGVLGAGAMLWAAGCRSGQPAAATVHPASSQPAARPAASGNPAPNTTRNAGNPSGSVLAVEAWKFEETPGRVIRTASYSLYTTDTQPIITDRLPGYMEAALANYVSAVGPLPRPSTRMDSFVMATRPQWQRLTLRMLGSAGIPVTYIERGGFTHNGRAYLFDIGAADTFSIASHEGWHQFSQTTFRERLPLCLEEGIAAFMEGHRWIGDDVVFLGWSNTERYDRLRDAAARKNGFLTLEQLFSSSPEGFMALGPDGPLTYYAQSWALVHFLREGEDGIHTAGFRRMIADAAGGHLSTFVAAQLRLQPPAGGGSVAISPSMVMRAYIDRDLTRLGAAFEDFQRRLVQTGGRDAIIEGKSPVTR